MSLTPAFAPDAKSQWRELDIELQELVLDELENVARHPPKTQGEVRRDAFRESSNQKHYLFIRFVVDRSTVTLVGIHHLIRD